MKSLKETAEKALVKASEVYIRYTTWGCTSFFTNHESQIK